MKITFRKSSYIVQLVQKKKKVRTIERGNYLTWASQAIKENKNGKIMSSTKSGILFSFYRKAKGKEVDVYADKHIYQCIQLEYVHGRYYQTLKVARNNLKV